MLYFCTYFDSNYLIKGLALYRSLVRHVIRFRLWVLCFDDQVYKILQKINLPEVIPILLRDFEEGDEKLLQAKSNRSKIEYYFTCTPSLPLYVLRNYSQVDVITYLDADLFFFSDPSPIYQELDMGSVLIIGHRFPPHLRHLEAHGIYNVGFLSFRRNDAGLECLHWWRNRCLKWCYDRAEDGCYADQKYLDDWPTRFQGVLVLQHKGGGLAPWNVENYSLGLGNGQVLVDSQPLMFFHFHGLNQLRRWLYDPHLEWYRIHIDSLLKHHIYNPYLKELQEVIHWITDSGLTKQYYINMSSIRDGSSGMDVSRNIFWKITSNIKHKLFMTKKIFEGHLLVMIGDKVI